MNETGNGRPSAADADTTNARVAALETLLIILLGRAERSDFGLLDSIKDELTAMQNDPTRKGDAQLSAADIAMLGLVERALNSASLSGGHAYRWKARARRIVQKWRGAKPS